MSHNIRYPLWEVNQIEAEHDYCKHPSLNKTERKEQICANKLILLETDTNDDSHSDDDDSSSDIEVDIESVPILQKGLYNIQKVKTQFEEIEKHSRKICYGNETPENLEPTEEEEAKLDSFITKVR
jgi:hypothetical protein